MTTGVVFFAYNTGQIDYLKLAVVAGRYVRRHMPGREICLITDQGSWDWFSASALGAMAEELFDDVVLLAPDPTPNKRQHRDSPYTRFISDFKNGNKHLVFDHSPYDQTLLLDTDYIVQNNSLDYVFASDSAVTMFDTAESLNGNPPAAPQQYLSNQGVPMLWSTAVYFNKHDPVTKMFFDMWSHVRDNYEFYQFLYGFPGTLFRTDFCVSIAVHLLNGQGTGGLIDSFSRPMINMSQLDDIVKINNADEWVYSITDQAETWKSSLTSIKNENVHVMNKRALDRNFNDIIAALDNTV
jgi:hypothetical protein